MRGCWLILVALLASAARSNAEPAAVRVVRFAPQGTVKRVRQVTARFSAPMVPLGDPRASADPFEIDCPEQGVGRWIDSSTWSYDFARDLPAGVRCTFTVRTGLTSGGGAVVGGNRRFTFSTSGAAIIRTEPYEGSVVEEEQAFVLQLAAEATEESVLTQAAFLIEGLPEPIGVKLLGGEARDAILQTLSSRYFFGRSKPSPGSVIILQARRRFPNGRRLTLVWGKGIVTATGVATGQVQRLQFKTRKTFTASVECERVNRKANCVPLTPLRLTFSASVPWERARESAVVGTDGHRWTPEAPDAPAETVDSLVFKGPFPEATTLHIELPQGVRDDGGRVLSNAGDFPLPVKTDPMPPLAKFAARFGIVEWKADPTLPVTLRNVEPGVASRLRRVAGQEGQTQATDGRRERIAGTTKRISGDQVNEILPWLRRVGRAKRDNSIFASVPASDATVKSFSIPKPHGANAFEVVGIPFRSPGLYIVEISSPRLGAALLGRQQPMYVPAAALVTNLAVHFKWGLEGSLAWVTTLDTAQPVAGAHVTVQDCRGATVWTGDTDRDGIAHIDTLPPEERVTRCDARGGWDYFEHHPALSALDGGLFVIAQTADDLSFVHSDWREGIESWRFQLPEEEFRGSLAAHTIVDRPLFRAGETVHMKHLLRKPTLSGFTVPSQNEQPTTLSIEHQGSNDRYEFPLQWDGNGVAESTWEIPKSAKLGRYRLILRRKGGEAWQDSWISAAIQVQEFRVPLMRGLVKLPAEPQVRVSEIPVDLSVQYLAGGGAGGAPVRLRAQIRPKAIHTGHEYERFTFANGRVKEGVQRRSGDEGVELDGGTEAREVVPHAEVHQRRDLTLDGAGTTRSTISSLPPVETPRDLLVELEFRDPNGEVQTAASTVPLWPARWLVGIHADEWMRSSGRVAARVAVVDTEGRPVAGAPVRVDVRQRKTYSHRKRLVGGFYAYDHIDEVGPVLGQLCGAGRTDANGLLLCDGRAPAAGNLVLEASVTDMGGDTTSAHTDVWSAGSDAQWFRVTDSDRIDVLPEKPRYEPGETARLQVRMPFREATALVTAEREGIADSLVVALSGSNPVVELPIKDSYAPNMFVSVLVVRGRASDVQPTALIDLGKPAFKLGIAQVEVGWRAHELQVSVTPERPVYRIREQANVKIAVRTSNGEAPPAGSEIAVAAVDEGLLELLPNRSWDVLSTMMGRRGYGVQTATAQMQVIGKRHYGRKALPQGGGGGRQPSRELFDTLLLWRGRVPLDRNGNASVVVPLNDSLTSFRIVAVATGDLTQFGTGTATIRSTQDLMILSGLAPIAREGDQIRSEFTVRNMTDRPMDVAVNAAVAVPSTSVAPQSVHLTAGEAKVVGWDIAVPNDVETLRYEVTASETAGARDQLRVSQRVMPAVPVRTIQSALVRGDRSIRESVAHPADAVAGRGGVQVTVVPRLAQGLNGVRDWMREYPYSCLEQRVSRAVALKDDALWNGVAEALPSYMDGDGLLKYFPTTTQGSDVLTAYVLSISHAARLVVPAEVQRKLEDGLRKFIGGSILRQSELRTADLSIRKLAAIDALARAGKADAGLLGSVAIEPNLWPTSALLDWWDILVRVHGIPEQRRRLQEVEQIVRGRLYWQGTTIGFSTEQSDSLWWLMANPETNAVRLILQVLQTDQWREDVPRLVRGVLARQNKGTWCCTIANAWGALAIETFSAAYEKVAVDGLTSASLAGKVEQVDWTGVPAGTTFILPWPEGTENLVIDHSGHGAPWVTLASRAAIPLKAPLSSGFRIQRTVIPVEPRVPNRYSRGDVLRVRIEIDAQSEMTWVVVNDPIPAGASHLGTGRKGELTIATQSEPQQEGIRPVFEERAFDAYRAYYRHVPKGRFVTEYTIRLNQTGRLQLPTTRVEALYAPEMFGEVPNEPVEVQP